MDISRCVAQTAVYVEGMYFVLLLIADNLPVLCSCFNVQLVLRTVKKLTKGSINLMIMGQSTSLLVRSTLGVLAIALAHRRDDTFYLYTNDTSGIFL